jgi:hypothetical protein
MLDLVVDKLVEALAASPDGVLAAGSMGARRPASAADLPLVAIGFNTDAVSGTGLGRYVGSRGSGTQPQPVFGDMYSGLLTTEVWGTTSAQVGEVARRLQRRLTVGQAELRARGFAKVEPASLAPMENLLYTTATGSPFAVWKQVLSFRLTFASAEVIVPTEGIISRIDIDLPQQGDESFSVPGTPVP